jgi:multidrug efflux system outer membrane protein
MVGRPTKPMTHAPHRHRPGRSQHGSGPLLGATLGLLGWSVVAPFAGYAGAQEHLPGSAGVVAPASPATAAMLAGSGTVVVQPPEVSDPMLTAPPPAAHEVRSWDEALGLLRAQSPDYITGYETIVRAAAQSRMALAAALPTLNGQGSYNHQFFTESIPFDGSVLVAPAKDTWAATATLQWNISPRSIYAVGTANRVIEVTKLSFEDRRRVIATTIVGVMLASLATSRVAQLNRVGLRSALERLQLTQARLQYGQGTPLDVDRAQQDVAAARALVITGDESLRQAREDLGAALGSAAPLSAPGDLDLAEFEASVARTCRLNDNIERRPDVVAARRRVEVAQRGVTDADLQFAPSLVLGSQAQAASASILGPLNTWAVSAALNIPIYDGGYRYGARRDARAAVEQARQALVATRLAAIVASAQAQRAVAVAVASRDVTREQRDLAARVDQRTRDAYRQGAGTSLDLVVSAQSLRQAEINLVILQVEVGRARANTVLADAECVY